MYTRLGYFAVSAGTPIPGAKYGSSSHIATAAIMINAVNKDRVTTPPIKTRGLLLFVVVSGGI
jgi:hypothetical protein